MTFLSPEEDIIMHAIKQYGVLRKVQLRHLLPDLTDAAADKIILGLEKNQFLIDDSNEGYVKYHPKNVMDNKKVLAFWVLLKYISKIKEKQHYKATYPSEIYFLKENKQYEIIVIETASDIIGLNILNNTVRINNDDDDDDDVVDEMRYFVVFQDQTLLPEIQKRMKKFNTCYVYLDATANPMGMPDMQFIQLNSKKDTQASND